MSGEPLYDPVANPYAPGAGTPPPELVGRDELIEAATISLKRLRSSRTSQHQMLTGLRGVGKTVLLGTLSAVAEQEGFRVIRQEALGGDDTVIALLRQAKRLLDDLDDTPTVVRAARSIESVSFSLAGAGLSVERTVTPDREALTDVVIDLAVAAAESDLGIALAIDEAQSIAGADLRRILAGVHRCGQDGLPLWCVLAGLPNLVGDVARAATYAERMFVNAALGPLTPEQVHRAVVVPSELLGVSWDDAAVGEIIDHSDGFPFFVQTWAYHTWNAAIHEPISADDVDRASAAARHALDSSFFAARIARIPNSEIEYVRALAGLGSGPHRSGAVAEALNTKSSNVSALRDRLINEGVVFSPRYGWIEFAIPHFDEYVRRSLP